MVAQRCASARPLLFVRVLLSLCLRSHVHAQLPSRRFYKNSCVPIAPLALPHAQCTQRTSAGRFVGLDAAPLLIFGLALALAGSLTTHATAAVYIDDGARVRPFGCALLIAGGLNNRSAYPLVTYVPYRVRKDFREKRFGRNCSLRLGAGTA